MFIVKDPNPHTAPAIVPKRSVGEPPTSRILWRILGIPLTIVIALLDHAVWRDLNVSVLYLIPIALASWKLGRTESVLVSAVSACVWFVDHGLSSRQTPGLGFLLLNTLGLFGVFITVGLVLSALRKAFADQQRLIGELQEALQQVTTLSSLLPICSWCRKVRDDRGYWTAVEAYFQKHSRTEFTHAICPECRVAHFKPRTGDRPPLT
jgi:K+-sensing histidine kinase KdpD